MDQSCSLARITMQCKDRKSLSLQMTWVRYKQQVLTTGIAEKLKNNLNVSFIIYHYLNCDSAIMLL